MKEKVITEKKVPAIEKADKIFDFLYNKEKANQATISKELKSQLEELAKKDNRSFNNYVITVLKEHVDNLNK